MDLTFQNQLKFTHVQFLRGRFALEHVDIDLTPEVTIFTAVASVVVQYSVTTARGLTLI